jgi:hypothetical protein
MKLSARGLGLAIGILWSVMLFVMTILSIYTGYAAGFLKMVASIYPWFGISWGGAFVGLVLGFIDGFIGGFVIAWIYNKVTG